MEHTIHPALVCLLVPDILTGLKVFLLRIFFSLVTQPLLFVGSLLFFLLFCSSAFLFSFFFSFFFFFFRFFSSYILVGKATYKFHTNEQTGVEVLTPVCLLAPKLMASHRLPRHSLS